MKFFRFFIKEVLLNGLLFVFGGTIVLSAFYIFTKNVKLDLGKNKDKTAVVAEMKDEEMTDSQNVNLPAVSGEAAEASGDSESESSVKAEVKKNSDYLDAWNTFIDFITGKDVYDKNPLGQPKAYTIAHEIKGGLGSTIGLVVFAMIIMVVFTLIGSSYATTSHYLAVNYGKKGHERFEKFMHFVFSVFAAIPLFVGVWLIYATTSNRDGDSGLFITPLIALGTVLFGGLTWDSLNFLKADMLNQVGQVHGILFSTLGDKSLGRFFPVPGTYSGYLFSSALPRFLPYIAGKVPAIIGSVTIAEIAFSGSGGMSKGIGSVISDAMKYGYTNTLVGSLFTLLCISAVVSFIVKLIIFLVYPRVYEAS